jgi:hypothetical protein
MADCEGTQDEEARGEPRPTKQTPEADSGEDESSSHEENAVAAFHSALRDVDFEERYPSISLTAGTDRLP